MTDVLRTYGSPLRYADGTSLTVETLDGLVRLTTRDADGAIQGGVMLTPDEAQGIGQAVLEAAFGARAHG